VKPATSGSSVGISIVKEFPDLEKALIEASRHSDDVLLEEYIKGKESTVGVIENFRGEKIYALPPVEIRPKTGFFDFQAKYQGKSEEIVPAPFDKELTRQLCDLAKKVHEVMGLKQYSRTDFIIHERRGVYVLEVNTLPGLTNESLIPKSLRAVGSDTHELVDHLISSLVQ
jgi:D-alanine-D-alanine ligase